MPRFAANLNWLLQEIPMLERFAAAKALGFGAVEIALPYAHAPSELADACGEAGLAFIMLNGAPGDMEAGEYGLAGLPGRGSEFRDAMGASLDYARALGAGRVHVLAGIVPDGESRERCWEAYLENLAWAAEACAAESIGVLLEPINTFERPGYLTTLTAEAAAAIEAVGHPNVAIQFDFHNAQLMEGCLTRALEVAIGTIGHMQIAGIPGRTPPDEGELNYPYLFELIDRLGYDGWVGCEYRPHGTEPGATKASLGWASGYGLG